VDSSTTDYILNWTRCTQGVPKLLCFNFELCFSLATLAANLYVRIEGYSDAKMTLISCIIAPSMAGLALRAPSGGRGKKVQCTVCLSVALLNGRDSGRDTAITQYLSLETVLTSLDRRRLVVVHRAQLCLYAARWRHHRMLKIKNGKIWSLHPSRTKR